MTTTILDPEAYYMSFKQRARPHPAFPGCIGAPCCFTWDDLVTRMRVDAENYGATLQEVGIWVYLVWRGTFCSTCRVSIPEGTEQCESCREVEARLVRYASSVEGRKILRRAIVTGTVTNVHRVSELSFGRAQSPCGDA